MGNTQGSDRTKYILDRKADRIQARYGLVGKAPASNNAHNTLGDMA